jgi:hypothetical protein
LAAVHLCGCVDVGAGIEQLRGDFDGVFRSFLTPAFDAVGGDVVQQRGKVLAR